MTWIIWEFRITCNYIWSSGTHVNIWKKFRARVGSKDFSNCKSSTGYPLKPFKTSLQKFSLNILFEASLQRSTRRSPFKAFEATFKAPFEATTMLPSTRPVKPHSKPHSKHPLKSPSKLFLKPTSKPSQSPFESSLRSHLQIPMI